MDQVSRYPGHLGPEPRHRIPRIGLETMTPDLRSALEPRVDRLGYLGEFFQCAANVPEALVHFVRFTDAAKGPLDNRIVELVAITLATLTQNRYELHQHERLAIRLGFERAWVQDVERLEPERLDGHEQLVQRYLLTAIPTHGRGAAAALETLIDGLGPEGAVAVMLLTGRYLAHALVVNALDLAPPVPSIFEDDFDGR
jgi:carboxymuconolactone decarboxylase family protein